MSDIDQPNQPTESTDIQSVSNDLDFSKLTHQNWLFINGFLATGNILKAYQLAKYEGTERTAPYQLFKRMKSYIESIGDLDVTSRARLQADIKSVLDIPLEQRQTLNLKEWLAVRKFTASITPEATNSKPQISVLIINRPSKEVRDSSSTREEQGKGDNPITSQLDSSKIIDADPLT